MESQASSATYSGASFVPFLWSIASFFYSSKEEVIHPEAQDQNATVKDFDIHSVTKLHTRLPFVMGRPHTDEKEYSLASLKTKVLRKIKEDRVYLPPSLGQP